MPSLVPTIGVSVERDGEMVHPPIGKPFDFRDSEVKEIRAHRHDALRKPVNESGTVVAQTETDLVLRGEEQPEADKTRDANLLRRAGAKGGPKARNQGGSLEEASVSSGGRRPEDEDEPAPDDDEL